MGARYAATGAEASAATSYSTALGLTGGTGLRVRVYDFIMSQSGTPADNAVVWALQRTTAAGTAGSSVTPAPLDTADPAASTTAGEGTYTIEPTYTASTELLEFALNQRASYRWVAAPGGELIVPATSANGMGAKAKAANYTGSVEAVLHFEE